ncbi:MAG: helix-turn-helix domain-containing protein [Acetivibrionales bacterium]|jgi:hypothetical protein
MGMMTILESIARAIKRSGQTRYQISKATGIDESVLHRIVNGGSCSMPTADILCKHLGLELKPRRKER